MLVLSWAKNIEVQSVQKAFLEAKEETKESKEFDGIKKASKQNHSAQNTKRSREMYPV